MISMLRKLMPALRGGGGGAAEGSRPVHLLGIGDPESIVAAAPLGLDSFDSAYPSRAARHGTVWVRLNLPDLQINN